MSAGAAPASVSSSRLYLIDTSAFARRPHPLVEPVIVGLLQSRGAATCITVDLESGYSGRDEREVRRIRRERAEYFTVLPITEAMAGRARDVQVLMASRDHHRAAGVVDLLTAAVAEHHGAVLLHYDADFEHIATVTGQAHLWVAPRGTI